jgi:streptogramin lyase
MPRLVPYVLALLICALVPASAAAAPTIDGIFPTGAALSGKPGYLTLGPDGNIWVALGNMKVARVTPQGDVTEFDPGPGIGAVVGITAGPDGNLWITGGGNVGKFSPADPTTTGVLYAGIPSADRGITTGPDNNLWAVTATGVVRFPANTDPEATDQPFPGTVTGGRGIAPGPNNTLVVADFNGSRLVSFTTAGVATPIATGGGPQEAIGGPGGQIGYTNPGATPETVGRVTPPGAAEETITPGGGDPFGITFANDGAYWIGRFASNDIMRFTTDGQSTFLSAGLPANAGPRYITKGQGDTLWASLEDSTMGGTNFRIARIAGVTAPTSEPQPQPQPQPQPVTDTIAPKLSSVALTASVFRLGSLLPKLSAVRRTPTGTTIRFRVDEDSKTTLSFKRLLPGRRVGRRCLKATRARRLRPRCTRLVTAGRKLTYTTKKGLRRVRFQGRFTRRSRLAPGRYELTLIATDAAKNASKPVRRRFTLKPALRRRSL